MSTHERLSTPRCDVITRRVWAGGGLEVTTCGAPVPCAKHDPAPMSATPERMAATDVVELFRDVATIRYPKSAQLRLDAAIAAHVAARVGEANAVVVSALDAAREMAKAMSTEHKTLWDACIDYIEGLVESNTTPEARDGE